MQAALRRLQAVARRWLPLARHRHPERLPIELHRRRIYIVPTRFGLGLAVLLVVMMAGALNYANNAALLLTCLFAAAAAASMLAGFRSLDGLRLSGLRAGQAMAGTPIELRLSFEAGGRARSALRLDAGGESQAFALPAEGSGEVLLAVPTARRGWQPLPRLKLWSTWPLGLFRAWSWLRPEQAVLVWPRPEAEGPPPTLPTNDSPRRRPQQGEDLASLRDYRPGDLQRHVAWKASARHYGLLVKDFEQPEPQQTWRLDWRALSALDDEARIARLARWLGEAEAQGRASSLWLPGEEIPADKGPAHYARCMGALARLP